MGRQGVPAQAGRRGRNAPITLPNTFVPLDLPQVPSALGRNALIQ